MKIAKALLVFVVILTILFSVAGCLQKGQVSPVEDDDGRIRIYTTFYPLYDFTKKIVGESAQVENLIPAGVEPHDFELSPKQAADIHDADIFIYLGESMEPWAAKMAENLESQGIKVIEAGKGLIENDDPHIWLDPVLAAEMAKSIFNGIVSTYKENEAIYRENLKNLTKKLEELDNAFKELASGSERKDLVTSHAFDYPARRYGLNQVAITGLSPQEEPSLQKMRELVEFCQGNGIKYIFTVPGENSKLIDVLSRDTGAEVLEINPLESLKQEEIQAGEDYFSVMEKNIAALKKALGY